MSFGQHAQSKPLFFSRYVASGQKGGRQVSSPQVACVWPQGTKKNSLKTAKKENHDLSLKTMYQKTIDM